MLGLLRKKEPLKILQWNIYWQQPLEPVIEFLKSVDADVLCLQEVMNNYSTQHKGDSAQRIADKLGFDYFGSYINKSDEGYEQGNMIFTRHKILYKNEALINEYDQSQEKTFDNENRSYVEVTLLVNGKKITIGTTHMSYTHRFEESYAKDREADKLLKAIEQHTKAFILCGDFNAEPGSRTITRLSKAYRDIGPHHDLKTWTTKPFLYQGFDAKDLNWRLDHIFATDDIKVTSSEVLRTDLSDHLPILTTVLL